MKLDYVNQSIDMLFVCKKKRGKKPV